MGSGAVISLQLDTGVVLTEAEACTKISIAHTLGKIRMEFHKGLPSAFELSHGFCEAALSLLCFLAEAY